VIWSSIRLFRLRLEALICIILNLLSIYWFNLLRLIYWRFQYLVLLLFLLDQCVRTPTTTTITIVPLFITILLLYLLPNRLLLISTILSQMELTAQEVLIVLYLEIQMTLVTCTVIDAFRHIHDFHWHLIINFTFNIRYHIIASRVLHLN